MRARIHLFAILLVVFPFLTGCESPLEGTGDVIEESRVLSAFEVLRLNCSADVRVHGGRQGESPKVVVSVEENLLPLVITRVDDPKLIIDFKEPMKSRSGVTVDVYNNQLMKVINSGSGSITTADSYKCDEITFLNEGSGDIQFTLKADEVRAQNEGSGDITIEGKCNYAKLQAEGSGDLDARGLRADEVKARNEGSGTLSVFARKELKALVKGSGDIKYVFTGDRENLDLEQDGSGQLVELSE